MVLEGAEPTGGRKTVENEEVCTVLQDRWKSDRRFGQEQEVVIGNSGRRARVVKWHRRDTVLREARKAPDKRTFVSLGEIVVRIVANCLREMKCISMREQTRITPRNKKK